MKYIYTILLSGFLCTNAIAQNKVTGYVYVDENHNNKFDKKEKGLANVAVSNGMQVSTTNEKGLYSLPLSKDNIIFIIKPSGYAVKQDAYNLPAFYYIHKPLGAPDSLEYKGVTATGPLPKNVNFALHSQAEPQNFKVLLFGDPQPYSAQELDYYSKSIVDDVQVNNDVKFGISLGDIVGNNLTLHTPYKEVMKKLNLPWYNVMGNHDMNFDVMADSLSDETFEKNFGPNNYAWNYGNAHFIILDNILYPDPRDGDGYWGGFRPDQLEFIKNDLQQVDKNKLIVISYHIPFSNEGGNAIRLADRKAFFDLLKDFPNCLLLSAHTHFQKQIFYKADDDWQGANLLHEYNVGTTSGDWYSGKLNSQGIPDGTMRDGTPRGYAYLSVQNNQYNLKYKVAGRDSAYQIQIYAPKLVGHKSRGAAQFYANFFMGGANDVVQYKIDNGKWKPMKNEPTFDRSYMSNLVKWDETEVLWPGRRPSNADITDHIWVAPVDKKLTPGEHTITVRATDRYGNVYEQSQTYKIQ